MKKLALWHLLLLCLFSYFFLFIPTSSVEERFFIRDFSFYSSQKKIAKVFPDLPNTEVVFHIPAQEQNYATYFRFKSDGTFLEQKDIPPENLILFEGKKINPRFRGYLTHPENGDYFIYYPNLGNFVLVFDRKGNFLWEKKESRYLQASPTGEYLIATAGDHSGFSLMNPSWETLYNFEGFLFTHFLFSHDSQYFCASSVGGEFIWINLAKKKVIQKELPFLLKSIFCNFEKKYVILQVEPLENSNKTEIRQYFLNEEGTQQILAVFPPSMFSWQFANLSEKDFLIVKENKDKFGEGEIYLLLDKKKLKQIPFPLPLPISEVRLLVFDKGVVLATKDFFATVDKWGITGIYMRKGLANMQKRKNFLYVADRTTFSVFSAP